MARTRRSLRRGRSGLLLPGNHADNERTNPIIELLGGSACEKFQPGVDRRHQIGSAVSTWNKEIIGRDRPLGRTAEGEDARERSLVDGFRGGNQNEAVATGLAAAQPDVVGQVLR